MSDIRTEKSLAIVDDLISLIADSTDEARQGAVFNRWLTIQKSFWRYSYNNTLLMAYQAKGYGFELSKVGGATKWKELGRTIKAEAWSKRLWILAPVFKKITDEEGKEKSILSGFRSVYVFDQSQTEGEELPKLEWLSKGDDAGLVASLEGEYARHGIELSYVDPALMQVLYGGAKGVSMGKTVRILNNLQGAERAGVLAHELAHSLLHFTADNRLLPDHSRSQAEIEAESVAACVLGAWGLDWQPSTMYLASWGGNKDRVRESMQRISATSKKILEKILPDVSE